MLRRLPASAPLERVLSVLEEDGAVVVQGKRVL